MSLGVPEIYIDDVLKAYEQAYEQISTSVNDAKVIDFCRYVYDTVKWSYSRVIGRDLAVC